MNSLYGNYRQKRFTEVYDNVEEFLDEFNSSPFGKEGTLFKSQANLQMLFYMIYARYGNSTIASSDINQFKYKMYSIIFQYGPTWERKLEIQDQLRGLSDEELTKGTTMIYNHSFNPSTEPSTGTLEELTTINDQNTSKAKRSLVDAYTFLYELLEDDISNKILDKFKGLFLKIVEPETPLWYVTDLEEAE